jgi:hypothetical protein
VVDEALPDEEEVDKLVDWELTTVGLTVTVGALLLPLELAAVEAVDVTDWLDPDAALWPLPDG